MNDNKLIFGTVTALKPAGGVIETKGGDRYYISNFDPFARKVKIGDEFVFTPTNPGDGRNTAEDLVLIKKC